ncbi:MAG: glycosyltransferase family 9 protein [bacterium]
MQSFLIIQTAFIGDVILAIPLLEKLRRHYPEAAFDFLVRAGCEELFSNHPLVRRVLVWEKHQGKYLNLWRTLRLIRKQRYDCVINCQRFAATGVLTGFSAARMRIGFEGNPLAWRFTHKVSHEFGSGKHEIERNLKLIESMTNNRLVRPRLYPAESDFELVRRFQEKPYLCIAPTSVWFTKQWPAEKWVELIGKLVGRFTIYLVGGKADRGACQEISERCSSTTVINLAGNLTLLQTAALMAGARMNYVNDSAPLHLASAMNAPVTVVFCSTVPEFGFGPLSDNSRIVQTPLVLRCRPCGIHGRRECPEKHFDCARSIKVESLLADASAQQTSLGI